MHAMLIERFDNEATLGITPSEINFSSSNVDAQARVEKFFVDMGSQT